MANEKKQDQPKVVQITIDEVITEIESQKTQTDPCEGCPNHTCEWGACCMADKK